MKPATFPIVIAAFGICALLDACKAGQVPAPPPPAEPPRFPEAPLVSEGASRCVVRRINLGDQEWSIETYTYDSTTRTLGASWRFDAQGRSISRGEESSDIYETETYDERGNLHESARWKHGQLVEGTRWENQYDGPRLVAQEISAFREVGERNAPRARIRYHDDASGHLDEVQSEGAPQARSRRRFTWKGERIVATHEAMEPRDPSETMAYDESRAFEYDTQGRLVAYVRDGEMPYGEGATADGASDQRETFHYDTAGRIERIERDGMIGDVAPEAPDGKADEVTLLSPPCDPIVKLAPRLFGFPTLNLPNSIQPPLR